MHTELQHHHPEQSIAVNQADYRLRLRHADRTRSTRRAMRVRRVRRRT